MTTLKQKLGDFGEQAVVDNCDCPICGAVKPFNLLTKNHKLVDVVCTQCGAMAQVKAKRAKRIDRCPNTVLGAAWGPQREQLEQGVFNTLFVVVVNAAEEFTIFCLPPIAQTVEVYKPRKPLSQNARRAGWQGFVYDLRLALAPATMNV